MDRRRRIKPAEYARMQIVKGCDRTGLEKHFISDEIGNLEFYFCCFYAVCALVHVIWSNGYYCCGRMLNFHFCQIWISFPQIQTKFDLYMTSSWHCELNSTSSVTAAMHKVFSWGGGEWLFMTVLKQKPQVLFQRAVKQPHPYVRALLQHAFSYSTTNDISFTFWLTAESQKALL